MLAVVGVAWSCNSLCYGAALGTLGSDCCLASVVVIERMIRLFSLIPLSTFGTDCTTLGGGCVGDVVGVAVGDLVSTNLSNSHSLCLLCRRHCWLDVMLSWPSLLVYVVVVALLFTSVGRGSALAHLVSLQGWVAFACAEDILLLVDCYSIAHGDRNISIIFCLSHAHQ